MDKRQVCVDLRRSLQATDPRQSRLRQHPMNCSVVNMQLARDGAGAPLLDVVVAPMYPTI